jgi:formamidopyrimidine-DNA glycosylase
MPELPEVETIRRQLEPELIGRRIERIEVRDKRWTRRAAPGAVEQACGGRRIEAVARRGKYLLLELEGGWTLALHLRMTGGLRFAGRDGVPSHLRAVILLEGGDRLEFTDARRFGHAEVVRTEEIEGWFRGRVGLEPLSDRFTPQALERLAFGRRAPLKSFLLAQDGIAGVGNIYADEALFRARLHPLSPAGSLRREHCIELREAIVATLEAGLDNGGATIDDYRDARGLSGAMQDEFLVHRREGEPCPRCAAEIRRITVAGRSTYFCPSCQRRLRRRRRRARR